MIDETTMMTELADLLDGKLDPEARSALAARLADEAELRDALDWLLGFRRTARALPMSDPSPWVLQSLDQHFARWFEAQSVLAQRPERVRAVLGYDSRREGALAGVRSSATDTPVGLVYECELGEISVEVLTDAEDRVRLLGQILLAADTTSPVFAVTAVCDGVRRRTSSDEFGRFRFDAVPARRTELRVDNGEVEIEAVLDLGGDAGT